ncbi:hypothetical protein Tco_1411390, partial [Tanacetum coccineum]
MSTRSSSSNLVPPSSDPESIIRNRRRNLGDPSLLLDFEEINIANNNNNIQGPPLVGPNFSNPDLRPMEKLLQAPTNGVGDAIVVPPILAYQFELKIGLLNLVTAIAFYGFENDDPHSNIQRFTKITQTIKLTNVPSDVVKLLLFSFSLEGAARTWLEKEPPNSITTWNDLLTIALQKRPRGVLPSNTVPNPWEDLKVMTTRSGITLVGPSVLSPPPSSSKEVERDPELTTDQVLTESTTRVPSSVVQPSPASELPPAPASSSMIPEQNPHQPPIPYPSSFAEALAHMPKYAKMVKDILTHKEKLLELANTPLNENCSAVILKKLLEKLRNTGRFLIPCDFY